MDDAARRTTREVEAAIVQWRSQDDEALSYNVLRDLIINRFATALRELEAERDAAKENADWLREAVGECHVMISRKTSEFQIRQDWDNTTLPYRLQRILVDRDALATRLAQAERERDNAVETGLRFLQSGCGQHTDEISSMSFQAFMEKYGRQCVPCIATRLASVEGLARELFSELEFAEMDHTVTPSKSMLRGWRERLAVLTPAATEKTDG